ncbi:MAG: alpha-1,2-fucosyltransferase [Flavobacteriales bacterium]|nr:alpha-1,2-fucosyltransferase [Flavobacteriales bacterium]
MEQVITRLMGGLGNQMFQYAAGYSLAQRLGVPLLLDRTFLDHRGPEVTWTPRPFELDVFQLPIAFASADDVGRVRRELDDTIYRRTKRILPFLFKDRCYVERGRTFEPTFFDLAAPVYIEGYWQDERYFLAHATELRETLFVPKAQPSATNAALLDAIRSTVSASIHVRRGDYVSLPDANRYHGVCSTDYYTSNAQWLVEHRGVQHFFIFSDDPAWVDANIRLPYPVTQVSHNQGIEGHWDLFLMKHCHHNIIANSSFSWWGAWLNAHADKTVIGPAKWFNGSNDVHEILPTSWLAR